MEKFKNQLEVCNYSPDHQKLTIEQKRTQSLSRVGQNNLFVDKLPYTFQDHNVHDLFSLYGEVVSVKMKLQ